MLKTEGFVRLLYQPSKKLYLGFTQTVSQAKSGIWILPRQSAKLGPAFWGHQARTKHTPALQ
jgi:hypothetical protein